MTTWRKEMAKARDNAGDLTEIVFCTLTEDELDVEFDNGLGGTEGSPFTMWTQDRVYFPVQYDGAEWVESVPRYPCNEQTPHIGGG